MSIVVYQGVPYGVYKYTQAEDSGTTQPQVVSAASTDLNTVRVIFDREMNFAFNPRATGLIAASYQLQNLDTSEYITILKVTKINDTTVDLMTVDQTDQNYRLTVLHAADIWEQDIDPAHATDDFVGTAPVHPAVSDIGSFFGLAGGMQHELNAGVLPVPPSIDNEDPLPSATGVAEDKIVQFDLLGGDWPIVLNTVYVYIEGALAYTGSTDSFTSPYNGGGSGRSPIVGPPAGHHFSFQKTIPWPSSGTVSVHVVAQDSIGTPLDETWSFDIEDHDGPTMTANTPTGTGVSKTATIYFELDDEVGGSGVDSTTIDVTVEGSAAIVGGIVQAGWTGTVASDGGGGYNITLNKDTDLPSYTDVDVVIAVSDLAGNPSSLGWTFKTEDYLGPHIIPVTPVAGEPDAAILTHVIIRFQEEDEVLISTMKVYISIAGAPWVLAYEGGGSPDFKPGWDGPASALTGTATDRLLTIDRTTPFPENTAIQVWVFAQDPTGNPERL